MNSCESGKTPSHTLWNPQRWHQTLGLPGEQLGLNPAFAALRPQFHGHWFECIPSTNQTLWELIAAGTPSGTVAIAAQQTAGRGQWGRPWASALGGLYLSLGLALPTDTASRPRLTLGIAWGLADAFNRLGLPVGIKWPNDLVYRGKKVGGILTEVRTLDQGESWAVIGVGLNWQNPVPPTGQALCSLRPSPLPPGYPLGQLEDLAAIALRAMIQGYYGWQQWEAPVLIQQYQRHLSSLGQGVSMADGRQGTVVGVCPTGYLLVAGTNWQAAVRPGEIALGYEGDTH